MNRRALLRAFAPIAAGIGIVSWKTPIAASMTLTPVESKLFVETLLNPPDPSPTLKTVALAYVRGRWKSADQLDQIMAILYSNRFRCVTTNMMYIGYPERLDPEFDNYDKRGRCMNMLTAEIENEYGEYGGDLLSSSIVFRGPCVEYHGYNDDTGSYRILCERYAERKQLLRAVEKVLTE